MGAQNRPQESLKENKNNNIEKRITKKEKGEKGKGEKEKREKGKREKEKRGKGEKGMLGKFLWNMLCKYLQIM